jgi:hypothetical protein
MTTIFSAPTVGDPRATGIKNGGIKAFESDIVYPVSRLVGPQFKAGKQMEFRWRSDSNRFWSPRDTKLYVRYKLQFGTAGAPADEAAAQALGFTGTDGTGNQHRNVAAVGLLDFGGPGSGQTLDVCRATRDQIKNVRTTAAANTCLFDGGMRYLQNSVVVENQTEPYTAAMAQLATKTDIAGTDTAGGSLSLRKDVGKQIAADNGGANSVVDNKADNVNPKQEMIALGTNGKFSDYEVAEPLFLASWQHGYAVGPSDHQLFLTIGNDFERDLLVCPKTSVGAVQPDYTECVNEKPTEGTTTTTSKVFVQIESVELHVAYVSPAQPFIPPSQSLRFSQFQVTTRVLRSNNVNESIIVPPGVRQILIGLRQNHHGINFDREELSKCGAEINEQLAANGDFVDQSDNDNKIYWWQTLQCQLGSAIAPTVAFSELDVKTGRYTRPYNEFLSVIGKPLGMRGNTMTLAQYIGRHSSNLPEYAGTGTAATLKSGNYGDMGPLIALRLLTPDSTLSNNLQIRGTLTHSSSGGGDISASKALQEMVVIVVADSLLNVEYAPPAEIPIKTSVSALV